MANTRKQKPSSVIGNATGLSGRIVNHNLSSSAKGGVIPFIFSPESLSDNVSANYQQTSASGSSAPVVTFSSTGARQVSLTLQIPKDYVPVGSVYNTTEEYLNAFRSLVYPVYTASGMVVAPHCTLTLPNISINGCCQSCSIDYKTDTYGTDGSLGATVSLSFLEILNGSKSSSSVAGSVGVSSTSTKTSTGGTTSGSTSGGTTSSGSLTMELLGDEAIRHADLSQWTDPGVSLVNPSLYTVVPFYFCFIENNDDGYYLSPYDSDKTQAHNMVTFAQNVIMPSINSYMQTAKNGGSASYTFTNYDGAKFVRRYQASVSQYPSYVKDLTFGRSWLMVIVYLARNKSGTYLTSTYASRVVYRNDYLD